MRLRHDKKGAKLKASFGLIIFLVLIGGIAYWAGTNKSSPTGLSVTGGASPGGGQASLVPAGGCNVAPTITYNVVDKYNSSTAGTTTNVIKVNGLAPVSTYATGAGGDNIQYLATSTALFVAPESKTLGCGATTIQATSQLNSSGGHTFNIFNDVGNVMTNGVSGTENLTLGSGGAKNVRLEFTAPSRQAVAPFGAVYCVEASSKTKFDASKMRFSGNAVPAPQRITLANAGGFINCVEDMTALQDSATIVKSLPVVAMNGQDPAGADYVYIHVVPKQYFADIDGNFKLGTEDSNNVNKAPNDYLYQFGFV